MTTSTAKTIPDSIVDIVPGSPSLTIERDFRCSGVSGVCRLDDN